MSYAVVNIISLVFEILSFLILADVIGSWILAARVRLPDWAFGILRTVHGIVAPLLDPIRRIIPSLGGLDLSPLVALLLLDVLRRLVVGLLVRGL